MRKAIIARTVKYFTFAFILLMAAVCCVTSTRTEDAPQQVVLGIEKTISPAVVKDNIVNEKAAIEVEELAVAVNQQSETNDEDQDRDIHFDVEDDSYLEYSDGLLALWVDGVAVVQTPQQIREWEEKLYSTKTYKEYMELLETVAYYNKGVDMSLFTWYNNGDIKIEVPNVIGMTVEKANQIMRNEGFYTSIKYKYDPEIDLPYGYCYAQEYPAGEQISPGENITIYIQSQEGMEDSFMPPYDELVVKVPNLIGLSEEKAVQTLKNVSITNIVVNRIYGGKDFADGVCISQNYGPGQCYYGNSTFYIDINDYSLRKEYVPYLIGYTEERCIEILESEGFNANIVYEYVDSDVSDGVCIWQEYPCQTYLKINTSITVKIKLTPQTSPQPEPTPEVTPTPAPEPTPEVTPTPIPEVTPTPTPEQTTEPEE